MSVGISCEERGGMVIGVGFEEKRSRPAEFGEPFVGTVANGE